MAVAASSSPRVSVDGKFLRLAGRKFIVKGVAYGPFAANAAGLPFASPDETGADFALIRELGANTIRIYQCPPRWFLNLADEHGLKILVDVPWNQHVCVLESKAYRESALQAVRQTVTSCAGHPAVLAYIVANEIPPDVVRWTGTRPLEGFIDEMVHAAKMMDPGCLCTFANFPSTEFLRPNEVDFVSFNVYLHHEPAYRAYLSRLQILADGKPLVLSETGVDSIREGEERKSQLLRWQIQDAFRGGLAGCVVFSFTDDWHRNGQPITGWEMGLTTRERQKKLSFVVVREAFEAGSRLPLARCPRVSVVIASYNAARTLKTCLESLRRLDYPDFEVIIVDDGSTDESRQIAIGFPDFRYLKHERNQGLSAARNTGLFAASGEIVAFTDADCRVDEDWLYYLISDLLSADWAAVGGPNLLPPEDSAVAAAVMASPGGPAHVMLTDRQAEHIPGCNMAFYKWALIELGGFDPTFVKAGDDVDICWRLQQAGGRIGFSPGGFVWHYRRSTIRDYLKQQQGYGEAEALLVRKHPEYFNLLGGSMWRGRIYAAANFGLILQRPVIYRGLFGSAGFQAMYTSPPASGLMLCTTLEYHVLLTLPLLILSAAFRPLLPVALTSLLIPVVVCLAAAAQAAVPRNKKRWWTRPLIAWLYLLQPAVRGWARYRTRLSFGPSLARARQNLESVALRDSERTLGQAQYWDEHRLDRLELLRDLLRRLEEQGWPTRVDVGWSDHDVEVADGQWSKLQVTTVAEQHAGGKQLFRARLRGRWSMRATVALWGMAGLELLAIGLVSHAHPWTWLLLLTLPLFAWFVHRRKRELQSIFLVFLDEWAKRWQLLKVGAEPEKSRTAEPEVSTKGSPFAAPGR